MYPAIWAPPSGYSGYIPDLKEWQHSTFLRSYRPPSLPLSAVNEVTAYIIRRTFYPPKRVHMCTGLFRNHLTSAGKLGWSICFQRPRAMLSTAPVCSAPPGQWPLLQSAGQRLRSSQTLKVQPHLLHCLELDFSFPSVSSFLFVYNAFSHFSVILNCLCFPKMLFI